MFVPSISTIQFHSIFFFNFLNPPNYSIFLNFPNPYTCSLNLNHSYHFKISKIKLFLHHFFKLFSNHPKSFLNYFFHPNGQNAHPKQGVIIFLSTRCIAFAGGANWMWRTYCYTRTIIYVGGGDSDWKLQETQSMKILIWQS